MAVHWGGRGPGHIARSIGGFIYNYYVDPVSGSDANPGTIALPLATLSQADTLVGTSTNKRIGIKRGTTLRNDPATFSAAGTYVGAYGLGARPNLFGSSQTAVSSFAKVGNLYTLVSHTFNPFTLALVDGSGNATKLYMASTSNGNSAVDPAIEGEWTFFPATHLTPNMLKFFTAATITGYQVEIPQGGVTRDGIVFQAADCGASDLSLRYWTGAGSTTSSDRTVWQRVFTDYNAADGKDAGVSSKDIYIGYGSCNYNGQRLAGANGPGDGVSFHCSTTQFSTGIIEFEEFIGNTQTGVGNQSGCQVITRYCYFEDNNVDYFVYNFAGAPNGAHTFYYNKIVHKTLAKQWSATNGTPGTANEGTTIAIRNNSVYYAAGITLGQASYQATGFTNVLENNVIRFAGSCSYFGWNTQSGANLTLLTSNNNIMNGFSTGVWQLSGGVFIDPTTETNRLTSDPLYTNGPAYDLTLQSGSPAIDSGTNWGQTQDYTGKPITGTPDRGAYER